MGNGRPDAQAQRRFASRNGRGTEGITLKLILQQDIKGKGKRGQMIEVSDGYARNYMLPRKLAVEATADNVNTMRMTDKANQERRQKEREEAFAFSNLMKDMVVVVRAKGGGAGRLFGSITTQEIADAIKAQEGIDIDKRKIVLDGQIKTLGDYKVKVKLGYEITAELKLRVEEQ